ncbi:MAG: galactokinase [Parashewanella sp.]
MQIELIKKQFGQHFQTKPQGLTSAPGRVNLMGEFTDYNQGWVLPCALEFRTHVAYRLTPNNTVMVRSQSFAHECDVFNIDQPIVTGQYHWANYVRAVFFVIKQQGHPLQGMQLFIDSDVPQGAGLSSSAALQVSVAGAITQACQLPLSTTQIALICQQAENQFMNCQCGVMDQLVAAEGVKGKAMMIDCQSLSLQSVSIPSELALIIINSNYQRKLVDSAYNQRRNDCETAAKLLGVNTLREVKLEHLHSNRHLLNTNQYKRALHVVTENQRVLDTFIALKANDLATLSRLMNESHQSLKNNFEVTVSQTNALVNICQQTLGEDAAVRMTGGGFGGAIVCLCRHLDVAKITQSVTDQYSKQFDLSASIYVCQTGGGLQYIQFD